MSFKKPFLLVAIWSLFVQIAVLAYPEFSGTCEHAAVEEGHVNVTAQSGTGGFELYIKNAEESLLRASKRGSSVMVRLKGERPFKGFLLMATDSVGKMVGSWAESQLKEGTQVHPTCKEAVTHTEDHCDDDRVPKDVFPYFPPQGLLPGNSMIFKVTIVEDFSTWYAFELKFVLRLSADL